MITKKLMSIREKLEKIPDLPIGESVVMIRKYNKTYDRYTERLSDMKINEIAQNKCLYMITDSEFGQTEILLIGDKFKCKEIWDHHLEINQDVFKDVITEIIRDNSALFEQGFTIVNPMTGTTKKTLISVTDRTLYLCPQLFNIENLNKDKKYN